jgi:hypothetical protein
MPRMGVAYLSDRVRGTAVGDLSSGRAVGGDGSHDLGRVRDVGPGVDSANGGEDDSSGELHFD